MPSRDEAALRPWLKSLGSLVGFVAVLVLGIALLPDPWPRVVSALLCAGLLMLAGVAAAGAWMDRSFRILAWGENALLRWTARFAADPGGFLLRWAEASPTLDRARDGLFLAAAQGSVAAMREIGRDYLAGSMGSEARAAGLPWLRKAADRGDAEAAFHLAEALRWGVGEGAKPEEALRCYQEAARRRFRPAALWLARACASGDGTTRDEAQAEAWATRAGELPGPDEAPPGLLQRMSEHTGAAAAAVDEFLEAGAQIEARLWPQRWFRRVVWTITLATLVLLALFVLVTPLLLRLALLLGFWLAATSLLLRLYGFGPQRVSRGTRRLEAKAAGGDRESCYELGRWYDEGHPDLPKDPVLARTWYERAARSGHPAAILRLADLLSWGLGGPRDAAEARRLLAWAAGMGVPEARLRLARMEPGLSETPATSDEGSRSGTP